jgi:hypothetical protein
MVLSSALGALTDRVDSKFLTAYWLLAFVLRDAGSSPSSTRPSNYSALLPWEAPRTSREVRRWRVGVGHHDVNRDWFKSAAPLAALVVVSAPASAHSFAEMEPACCP